MTRTTVLAHSPTRPQQVLQIHLLSRPRFLPRIPPTTRLISVIFSLVIPMAQKMANSRPPLGAGRLPVTQRRRGTLKGTILETRTGTGADRTMGCKRYHWAMSTIGSKKRNRRGTLRGWGLRGAAVDALCSVWGPTACSMYHSIPPAAFVVDCTIGI